MLLFAKTSYEGVARVLWKCYAGVWGGVFEAAVLESCGIIITSILGLGFQGQGFKALCFKARV